MNLRKTHEQYVKEVERKNNKVIIIGTYSGATNYIKAKCKRCGNEWDAKAYSLLSGRACPKCKPLRGIENNKGKTRKKSHNQFLKELINQLLSKVSIKVIMIVLNAYVKDVEMNGKQWHIRYCKVMVAQDVQNLEQVSWNNL